MTREFALAAVMAALALPGAVASAEKTPPAEEPETEAANAGETENPATVNDKADEAGEPEAKRRVLFEPRPYVAEYSVKAHGMNAGTMTAVMAIEGGGWLRQTIALPTGLAKMLIDTILEDSRFNYSPEEGVQPLNYHLREQGGDRSIKVEFGEGGSKATVNFKKIKNMGEGPTEHDTGDEDIKLLDDTNWLVQAAHDFSAARLPRDYQIIGIPGMPPNRLELIGEEMLQLGDREHPCVVIKRTRTDRADDYINVWLAKDLDYVPARIERLRKGKQIFLITLSVVSFGE